MKTKMRPSRRWQFRALLASAVAFVTVWVSYLSSIPTRRYVSPPMPGGTRYTFVYPTWFNKPPLVAPNGICWLERRDTLADEAVAAVRVLMRRRSLGPQSFSKQPAIRVSVYPLNGTTRRMSDAKRRRNGMIYHNVPILDPRGKKLLVLHHQGTQDAPERFEKFDAIIRPSFQVLPPGAPVS